MSAIYPVSPNRVSDLLLQKRLLSHFETDKSELLRLQNQLSTGQRISVPSEDASAASRAIPMQRLLEQKSQVKTNLSTSQSHLGVTDNALSSASDVLSNVHARTLNIIGTPSTDEQRQQMGQEVRRAIERLVGIGNQKFRGRRLFAGSTADIQPFELRDDKVIYHGDEGSLRSFVDVGFLADTNVNGNEAFGGFSTQVSSSADLKPVLSLSTRLDDLHGGAGVDKGAFVVSDGTDTKTIDISNAATIEDVVRLIEQNPPQGREIVVRLSGQGLVVDLDDEGGGNLTIREANQGKTARQLGIEQPDGAGTSPLVGSDLHPRLKRNTSLRDILGTQASALLPSDGAHNDILLEAAENGAQGNDVQVRFSSNAAAGDQALVTFDEANRVLDIDISPGVTTARTVVQAINDSGTFTARLDDKQDPANDGTGVVQTDSTATTSGGSGSVFDRQSGIQVANGGQSYTFTFEEAESIQDILNTLNTSEAGLLAEINADGTGIDVRSRVSGSEFQIGENGGTTAAQLGLRTFTRETRLEELNFGRGVESTAGTDFVIQRKDGTQLEIDISEAQTIGDVIELINDHADNTGNSVQARLAEFGNGIELHDENAAGAESLKVTRARSLAANELGLIPPDQSVATADELLGGRDVNPREAKGVFNSLLRLDRALDEFDLPGIERAAEMLDDDFSQLNFMRAEVGSRAQNLESLEQQLENEEIEIRSRLSEEIDTDLAESISDLTARQANMEATLRLIGRSFQLSLLNFL